MRPWIRERGWNLSFLTIAADSREAVLALVAKYRAESVARAFEMAWTHAQLEFRYLRIGAAAAQGFQELGGLSALSECAAAPVSRTSGVEPSGTIRSLGVWISGDLPMVTVTIAEPLNLSLVRELLLAHTYWRLRGFRADLIILNQEARQLRSPLASPAPAPDGRASREASGNRSGGVFLLDWHLIPEEHRNLLLAASQRRAERKSRLACSSSSPAPKPWRPPPFVPWQRPRQRSLLLSCRFSNFPISTDWAASLPTDANTRSIWRRARPPPRPGSTSWRTRLRHSGDRERPGVHLERQQPAEPADAVAQRSGERSAIRRRSIFATTNPGRVGRRPHRPSASRTPIARGTARATRYSNTTAMPSARN